MVISPASASASASTTPSHTDSLQQKAFLATNEQDFLTIAYGNCWGRLSNLEVWFQWPKDIVRKLVSGDLDLGIVGLDTVSEYGQIPKYGIFENANSMKELAQMRQWTPEKPLRVATGFTYLGSKFMKENGVKHVTFSTADGALEAAPAIGIAEAIVDLVSRGTTLRENNLKEIEGGVILQSQAVLVASKKSLTQRKGVLDITHEILERLEAHLRAIGQFTVTANMRGSSQEEVAERILSQTSLSGLQGPTISPIFCKRDGRVAADYYAIVICVPKKLLYKSVQQLRATQYHKPFYKNGGVRCFVAKGQAAGVLTGHIEGITFIDNRGDGRYFISNGKDQAFKLWDIQKMSSNVGSHVRYHSYSLLKWDGDKFCFSHPVPTEQCPDYIY
ncbi:hypothetical protein HYC85_031130 [Camellia sinensis]|uniref:ATP phosphoribosyltransferase n=1 Tax=Camellia sinensis TaxID=4442 RepID=A0A7J7FQJ6_CAMSI|nr:hypothetical protein HYC85_031130 [Camellia sinensis]